MSETEVALWVVARGAGVAAYAALCISMLTGLALRTDALDPVWTRRAMRALHDFAVWIWIPLGAIHVDALVLDSTARIGVKDLVVPFVTSYGQLAIGLGTLSLDIAAVVVVTSWMRSGMSLATWSFVHRLSYAAFGLAFAHSLLSGTDFASSVIGAVSVSVAAGVGLLALSRLVRSRAPE